MRQWILGLATACVCTCVCGQNVSAQAVAKIQVTTSAMLPANGGFQRLANMDAIVVGRVIGLEPMDVSAAPAPGQANASYRIAVVQLSDRLHGVKNDAGMIRVGFLVSNPNGFANVVGGGGVQIQPANPGGPAIARPMFRVNTVQLQVGQDGLFLLAKHHKENFYLVPTYNHFVSSQNNTNYANEVNNAKQLGKVLGDVRASLKSEDRQERYLAAAVLVSRYRNHATGATMKQEPIDTEESKHILKALAEGDWTPGRFSSSQPSPIELFLQLGITAKDGYTPVAANQQAQAQAMQKWLSDNGASYVIKKLVVDPNAKVGQAAPVGLQPAQIRGLRGAPGVLPVVPPAPAAAPRD